MQRPSLQLSFAGECRQTKLHQTNFRACFSGLERRVMAGFCQTNIANTNVNFTAHYSRSHVPL